MKYLRTKATLALALTLTLGALLSASTAPVRAHGTQSAVALAMVEEQEVAIVSLARAAWSTRAVRGLAYVAAGEIAHQVTTALFGVQVEGKTVGVPKDALD